MKQLPEMPRLNRRFRMQWEEAQQAHVLLYPEGMVRLNQSAAEILRCCDGLTTVDGIVAQLERRFNARGLRSDIVDLLAHALEKDWIQ
jgi:pyrroloquinoline quinone biosynthesis protein D